MVVYLTTHERGSMTGKVQSLQDVANNKEQIQHTHTTILYSLALINQSGRHQARWLDGINGKLLVAEFLKNFDPS